MSNVHVERLREDADEIEAIDLVRTAVIGMRMREAADELDRLHALLNTPHTAEFLEAVKLEAIHQRERWGTDHDEGKTPDDWLWLVAFLTTKATQAERYGDHEKYLHHIITAAAACCNWHAHATGADTRMKPGAPTP